MKLDLNHDCTVCRATQHKWIQNRWQTCVNPWIHMTILFTSPNERIHTLSVFTLVTSFNPLSTTEKHSTLSFSEVLVYFFRSCSHFGLLAFKLLPPTLSLCLWGRVCHSVLVGGGQAVRNVWQWYSRLMSALTLRAQAYEGEKGDGCFTSSSTACVCMCFKSNEYERMS